jgi:hypothetical protein
MKITVSRQELSAALLFASTDESRYVLNGVLIECRTAGVSKPTLVATDGRRLAVIETIADQDFDEREDRSLLLKADFIKPLCSLSKSLGGKNNPWIQFSNKAGSNQVRAVFVGSNCVVDVEDGALIEGQFPNWRQILPAKNSVRRPINDLGINSEMVGDFAKAAKIMESETPIIQMNLIGKEAAIEVRLCSLPSFYGLIMPCKADESIDYQPEFLQVSKLFPPPKPDEEKPMVKSATEETGSDT